MYREQEDVTFKELDEVEREILNIAEEVAYLCLIDRTGEKELQVARIEATAGNLLPYIERGRAHHTPLQAEERQETSNDDDLSELGEDDLVPDDEIEADESEAEDGSDEQSPLEEAVNEEPTTSGKPSQRMLLIAACRWIRAQVRIHVVEWKARKYRVRLYSSKGARVLLTGSFVAINNREPIEVAPEPKLPQMPRPGPAPEPPAPVVQPAPHAAPGAQPTALYNIVSGTPAPQTTPMLTPHHDVAMTGAAAAYRHLGDCYTQFGDLVLGSVSSLQNVLTATNRDLGTELRESRGQVDTLVGSVLEYRVQELQHTSNRQQVAAQDHRTALARDAIHQLGETAKAFFVSKGIPPTMAEVMQSIGSSPELLEVLDDPSVREVLRDPRNLQGLAGLLKQVGQQYQAQKAGGAAPAHAPHAGAAQVRPPGMPPGYPASQSLPQGYAAPPQQLPPGYGVPQHYPPGYSAPQQHPVGYGAAQPYPAGIPQPHNQGGQHNGYGYAPGAVPQYTQATSPTGTAAQAGAVAVPTPPGPPTDHAAQSQPLTAQGWNGGSYPPGYGPPQAMRPVHPGSYPGQPTAYGGMHAPGGAGIPAHAPPGYVYGAPPMYQGQPYPGASMGASGVAPPAPGSQVHEPPRYGSAPAPGSPEARPASTGDGPAPPSHAEPTETDTNAPPPR